MDIIEKNLMRLPRKAVAPDLASRINQRIHEENKLVSSVTISPVNQIQNRQWAIEQEPQPVLIYRPPRRVASGINNILRAMRGTYTTMYERRNQCL